MSVQAAKKKPKAVVTATYTTLPNGKVVVQVTSNATKVQVKYRTTKNKKRALNKKLKRGTATITLPVGSKTITVRAKATSKLATSPWTPATPPAPPAPPAPPTQPAPPAQPVSPPVDSSSHSPGGDPACGSSGEPLPVTSGAIQRVNTSSSGAQAVGYNEMSGPVFSPDGDRVAFSSWSTNLVDGDTNGTEDIFVKTLATGVIERISVTVDGTQANGGSRNPQWSPDGTRIGFLSKASNLTAGADGRPQLYVKTLDSGAVQLISSNAAGEGAEIMYSDAETAWSPDGARIAFSSKATNLVPGDTNATSDIFVKTLAGGSIERISTTATGGQAIATPGDGGSFAPAWSPAGDRMAFASTASNLVDSDTNDAGDVFVKSLVTGAVTRVSVSAGAGQADDFSDDPVWFPSGDTTGGRGEIAFTSQASNLVDGDTNGVSDVFVKDLLTGDIERVSTTATGGQGTDASLLSYSNPAKMWSPSGFPGQWITFLSWAPNLVDGDTNGVSDIFVKNVTTGAIERISLSATGQQADSVSREPSWAPSGDRIVFGSWASNLVDGDTNGEYDIFIKTLS